MRLLMRPIDFGDFVCAAHTRLCGVTLLSCIYNNCVVTLEVDDEQRQVVCCSVEREGRDRGRGGGKFAVERIKIITCPPHV